MSEKVSEASQNWILDPKSTPSQVQINFDVDELRTFKISSRSIAYAPQAKIVEPELSA